MILTVRIVFPWALSGEKAPRIDMDKIPKEIKVDAGDVIDLNIPCIALPPPKVKLLIDGEEESTWKMRMGKIGPPKVSRSNRDMRELARP